MRVNDENEANLLLGKNEQKTKDIFISDKNRLHNLLIMGKKGVGKTKRLLPFLAKQEIMNRKAGSTFIVSGKDSAHYLYALAKKQKRHQIVMLKPSYSIAVDRLFQMKEYDEAYINQYVLNYKEAIRHKKIVIIDLEILRTENKGIRLTAYLLESLKRAILETKDVRHHLYVDDAEWFIPYMEGILSHGNEYGVATTLLCQSRASIERNKGMVSVVDDCVRNMVLMASMQPEDYRHYEMMFHGKNAPTIQARNYREFQYSTFNENRIMVGNGHFSYLEEEENNVLIKSAKIHAGKLSKEYEKLVQKEKSKTIPTSSVASYVRGSSTGSSIQTTELEKPVEHTVVDNLPVLENERVSETHDVKKTPVPKQEETNDVKPLMDEKKTTAPVDKRAEKTNRFIILSGDDDDYVF